MSTASIPELRSGCPQAQTCARAQLARAAVRYGKRALARRGSSEDGPPSEQEAARTAAGVVGCGGGDDGGGPGTPRRRQLAAPATALGGRRGSQP